MSRVLLPALLGAAALAATHVAAAEFRPFSQAGFAAAQAGGRPIVVDVFATWCPTCAAQAPVLRQLSAAPRYKDLVVFQLNYDTQKQAWRALRVSQQSTLIAFKGRREIRRSVGATDPGAIGEILNATGGQ